MKLNKKNIFSALSLITLLSACGGGGGSSNDSDSTKVSTGNSQTGETKTCLGFSLTNSSQCIETSDRKAYLLKVGEPKGLAILLHGSPGSPKKISNIFGANLLSSDFGFTTLILKGSDPTWGWNSTVSEGNQINDEVSYISELIDSVIADNNIPSDKVIVMGYSAGGFMAYKLACQIPEKLAGIISIAGQLRGSVNYCTNSTPVAVHHMHNPQDTEVPVMGGRGITSLNDTLEHFMSVNGCSGQVNEESVAGVTSNDLKATEVSYLDCEHSLKYTKLHNIPHESSYEAEKILQQLQYMIGQE
ncbi:hypothetical protein C1E23_00670 [Pseudoalteromonas phenolica]|uniref:Phospholipase/carboxylesterase/thioesterase domain-containing protein n=1 Tax=Pseudoalteromonas phenolica TaxID=161398 RepID=A0A4Q7ISR3_9GAMM|nr:alpha/beta fold hydrolase [Pseudoalteromonas phenolica]RZQ55081.1 hypothetical protein C1E23_00670 [Pseudoalteromonas phenolica]